METIGIEIKRYDELLKKETVYDIYRNKLLKDEFVSMKQAKSQTLKNGTN